MDIPDLFLAVSLGNYSLMYERGFTKSIVAAVQAVQLHTMEQDQNLHIRLVHAYLDIFPPLSQHQDPDLRLVGVPSHAVRVLFTMYPSRCLTP